MLLLLDCEWKEGEAFFSDCFRTAAHLVRHGLRNHLSHSTRSLLSIFFPLFSHLLQVFLCVIICVRVIFLRLWVVVIFQTAIPLL